MPNNKINNSPLDDFDGVLLLSKIRVQNANAISSPLTWGFPAPSAFTGFTHALQRKLNQQYPVELAGIAIISHAFEPQVDGLSRYRPGSFSLSRNPVGKDGKSASIVEEGRAHLTVTLAIAVKGLLDCTEDEDDLKAIADTAQQLAYSMRLAGGSVLGIASATLEEVPETDAGQAKLTRKLKRQMLPGFALVSRPDYMQEQLEELRASNPAASALDVIMDAAALTTAAEQDDDGKVEWKIQSRPGWRVPLAIGYQAISDLYEPGTVINARDNETPMQFVESAYSIGEWVSPHRITSLSQLFWYHHSDIDAGEYHCINHYV